MIATGDIRKGVVVAERYRVLRRVGAGGMATVWLAEDERLGREVAIKRLHTDAPKASLKRFEREAKLGAALNHPNFVAVYDTVETEEGALIVMEFVPGRSLAEVAADGPLSPERVVPVLREVAEALDHAHAQGVVHRDVKPSNVIVRDDGIVKLADLGIARAVGATQITSEGSVIGTLPYMAPERMRGPGSGGPESDIYALGAVAYELLTGQPPRDTTSTEEAAHEVPDLRAGWPDAPRGAIAVLERALDPEPSRRQASAGRFVEELDAVLSGATDADTVAAPLAAAGAGLDEPAPTPPTATAPRRARPSVVSPTAQATKKVNRGLALAVLALAVLAVAGIAIGGSGGGDGGDGGSEEPTADAAAAGDKQQAKEPKPEPEPAAPAAEPVSDSPSGAELNDQGFALIQEGRYDEAIPILEQAVDALEGSGDELTYNYALFNLGNALRLAGRPEEAIPILEQRLQFPDQRGEVLNELAAAYEAAGLDFPGGRDEESGGEGGSGNGNGNKFGHGKGGGEGDD